MSGDERTSLSKRWVYIYALYDKRDGGVRYVGQTERLIRRVKQHLREPSNRFVKGWIIEMRRSQGGNDKRPRRPDAFDYRILESRTVYPGDEESVRQAKERLERKWITKLEERGHPLLNDLSDKREVTGPVLFGGSLLPRKLLQSLADEARSRDVPVRQIVRKALLRETVKEVRSGSDVQFLDPEVNLPTRE